MMSRVPRPLTLFLLTVVLVLLGLALRIGLPIYKQQIAIREVRRLGGDVSTSVYGPAWLVSHLPNGCVDALGTACKVHLANLEVTDAETVILEPLTNLRFLSLNGTQVSDSGLACLGSMSSLQDLDLSSTQITEVGLRNIEDLKRLRRLYVHSTLVKKAYLRELVQRRPGLEVYANGDIYK
jgi:hypothetical protein